MSVVHVIATCALTVVESTTPVVSAAISTTATLPVGIPMVPVLTVGGQTVTALAVGIPVASVLTVDGPTVTALAVDRANGKTAVRSLRGSTSSSNNPSISYV